MKDMGKSMKLIPFVSHSKQSSYSPCPFPSCANIDTLSFRHYPSSTINPFETITASSSSEMSDDDPIESVISGLRSERLFFDPKESCSLMLDPPQHDRNNNPNPNQNQNSGEGGEVVFKESEALCMESNNPCEDFRRSMEEMVEAHGLNDWHGLEQLLGCYLKINDKLNHGYIMGAFIDLLVNLDFVSTNSTSSSSNSLSSTNLNCSSSPSSPLSLPSSSLTTPCLSSLLDHDDDDDHDEEANDHHHDANYDDDGDDRNNTNYLS
ncbi:hypothetical protein RND81_01G017300 [Saponaria officinalis]|uniref:Transcription repressor n=1 Tax=Saponaria officinalis TaxID=3572 RepID=A0AAW1N570_SAPOF